MAVLLSYQVSFTLIWPKCLLMHVRCLQKFITERHFELPILPSNQLPKALDVVCQQKIVCKREEQKNYLCGGEDLWKPTFTHMLQWSFTSKVLTSPNIVSRLACNTFHWKNNLIKWTFGGKILQGTLLTAHAVCDWHRRPPSRSFSLPIIRNFCTDIRCNLVPRLQLLVPGFWFPIPGSWSWFSRFPFTRFLFIVVLFLKGRFLHVYEGKTELLNVNRSADKNSGI